MPLLEYLTERDPLTAYQKLRFLVSKPKTNISVIEIIFSNLKNRQFGIDLEINQS